MATLSGNLAALCPDLDAGAVREIIDTDLTDARINAFLNMAYHVSRPVHNNLDGCGGAEAECDLIKLLAAHFVTLWERQVKSESIGGEWSVTYLGKEGVGLEASLYGQQALAMDCSGNLARASLRRASISVTSHQDVDDIDWSDLVG